MNPENQPIFRNYGGQVPSETMAQIIGAVEKAGGDVDAVPVTKLYEELRVVISKSVKLDDKTGETAEGAPYTIVPKEEHEKEVAEARKDWDDIIATI